jgi:hypothetical protein
MHTKINKHPIDPNFLTHILRSKNILGMEQVHLELSLILFINLQRKSSIYQE